jgi:glycosyltransferase involved in cell wall biosynthesis
VRIAIISLYEAWPPTSGAASVTYGVASHLQRETWLFQFSIAANTEVPQDHLSVVSLAQSYSSRVGKLLRMPLALRQLVQAVARVSPDIVVIEGASWAVYLAFLVRGIRRLIPGAKIAYHAHNVEYLLRRQNQSRIVSTITWYAERYLLGHSDFAFAPSTVDQASFLGLYGRATGLLPNGIDTAYWAQPEPFKDAPRRTMPHPGTLSILFMGLYNYPPNREAVDFLILSVMPIVRQSCPEARLVVTGGDVPYSEPWLVNPGTVPLDELRGIIRSCDIGVAPIFRGSGTRLKILEYMASGLPVVSTRKGAEGLALEDEKDALYAETPQEFADAILRLGGDAALCQRLARRGEQVVWERFDWRVTLREFCSLLKIALGDADESALPATIPILAAKRSEGLEATL